MNHFPLGSWNRPPGDLFAQYQSSVRAHTAELVESAKRLCEKLRDEDKHADKEGFEAFTISQQTEIFGALVPTQAETFKTTTTTTAKSSETPKRHGDTGRPRTPVWRAYGLFSPVSTATPPLCVGGYRWLCIQRLVRYRQVAARASTTEPKFKFSEPSALDLVNSHSILPVT